MTDVKPTLGKIIRQRGVAGQISYTVAVTYPGEPTSAVSFVGSVYGGPVVMISANGSQTFVTHPQRFGRFGPAWVRAFFA